MNALLKAINKLFTTILVFVVISLMIFSAFSIWDNNQVFTEAENVQSNIINLKPKETNTSAGFTELRKVDENICAWLTVDNTAIDYPVVQGDTNLSYLNKDVYGNFSLAGSIYMDSRNSKDLSDRYILIYGHHMENNLMFGDLDLFKDKDFFTTNQTAQIMIKNETAKFNTLAIMEVPDSTEEIFNPDLWSDGFSGLYNFIKNNAMYLSEDQVDLLLLNPKETQIVALVTCSSGATGNRTVLLLIRKVDIDKQESTNTDNSDSSSSDTHAPKTGDTIGNTFTILILSMIVALLAYISKNKNIKNKV